MAAKRVLVVGLGAMGMSHALAYTRIGYELRNRRVSSPPHERGRSDRRSGWGSGAALSIAAADSHPNPPPCRGKGSEAVRGRDVSARLRIVRAADGL
jgi:hypothetical protein